MRITKITFLALLIAGILVNCKEDKKKDNTALLLLAYAADQASGNCATITKFTAADGKVTYSALGTTIPKGGCNAATLQTGLYSTSPSEVVTAVGTYYDALKAVYDTDTTNCSSLSTAVTTAKSALSTSTVTTTQTALTSGTSGCSFVNSRVVSSKVSGVFICKDDASVTAVKALSSYQAVSSVATDMSASLADLKTTATALKNTTGFTDTAIAAMKAYGATEAAVFSSVNYSAWINAFGSANCAKGIATNDAALKTTIGSLFGGSASTFGGPTTTEAASITTAVTSSLKCGYGTGFTAVTTTGLVNPTCPSTYPTY